MKSARLNQRSKTCALVLGLYLFNTGTAADMAPKPGLWSITSDIPAEQKAALAKMKSKITVQSRQSGLSFDADAGTITLEQCLNTAQRNDWHRMGLDQNLSCDKPTMTQTGLRVSIDVRCSQPKPATLHSEIEFSANREQYRFDHLIYTDGTAMRLKGQARRLGDCP
jgi:hypothetical protein